jgi:hypothetical protein
MGSKCLERDGRGLYEVAFRYLIGRTEGNHETHRENSLWQGQGSNLISAAELIFAKFKPTRMFQLAHTDSDR